VAVACGPGPSERRRVDVPDGGAWSSVPSDSEDVLESGWGSVNDVRVVGQAGTILHRG
jgi:hypothetical protein